MRHRRDGVQVLVAYAFDAGQAGDDAARRLDRVQAHYGPLWQVPVRRSGADAAGMGLHLWDTEDPTWRWPSWDRDERMAVATLYLPLGYERVVGDIEPERAPLLLARALHDGPERALEMTGPFVVASLEAERPELRLHTDPLGIGRLFELRFDGGWVWLNRPAAACRFAGVRAEADRDGWRMLAAAEWFMRERTPITNLFAVPGGAVIRNVGDGTGPVRARVDALGTYAGDHGDPLAAHRVDDLAHALTGLVTSIARMAPVPLTADLSGGRDSRVVVAAVVAAGLEVDVQTNGAEAGEADTAEELVAALRPEQARLVTHRATRPTVTGAGRTFGLAGELPILANALSWHRSQEGLHPPSYLPATAPAGLAPRDRITIGGAGGEIAHGHYYPADYASLGAIPPDERVDRITDLLCDRLYGGSGASAQARATTRAAARETIAEAARVGLTDAKALDYFYAAERLRRWGSTGASAGSVSPLIVPEFVRAAFTLSPDQRRENALHRAVTARLVPEWAAVDYYRRPAGLVQPRFTPRLATVVDRDAVTSIVRDQEAWSDAFDGGLVTRAWSALLDGQGGPADERLLQRVIWRAVFDDFLHEVNDEQVSERIPTAPSRARTPGALRRGRLFVARGLRKAARVIEPGG